MMTKYKHDNVIQAQYTIKGVTYTAYYTNDTRYFGGSAWVVYTNKGGQRLYPSSMPPEQAIREWSQGLPPRTKKVRY